MSDNTTKNIPALPPQDGDDGIIVIGLRKVFGRSWKTSLAGILGLAGTIGAAVASIPPPLTLAKVAPFAPGLITSIGVWLSKDANVSGPPSTSGR